MATDVNSLSLMLTGDVMLGRGVDQILPHPSKPELHEPFVRSALGYVALAERLNGPIPRQVSFDYVWGDALSEVARYAPSVRVINLETAVTTSDEAAPKGINYRMHPRNIRSLSAASIDCCILANNHVLDWGEAGLLETLDRLHAAGIQTSGAGRNPAEARRPAVLPLPGGRRALVYAGGLPSSGVPGRWAAAEDRPGVNFIAATNESGLQAIAAAIAEERRPNDLVIMSLHWGPNWGYQVTGAERKFAHQLIDDANVDIVHGHSSHHPKAIEFHAGRAILYGCGDMINDYEGIAGEEEFRPNLSFVYLVSVAGDGSCSGINLLPFRIERFRLSHPNREEAEWLTSRSHRQCREFGGTVELTCVSRDGPAYLLRLRP